MGDGSGASQVSVQAKCEVAGVVQPVWGDQLVQASKRWSTGAAGFVGDHTPLWILGLLTLEGVWGNTLLRQICEVPYHP